jgi:molybdate/tungstate transport system substrate-binding protein
MRARWLISIIIAVVVVSATAGFTLLNTGQKKQLIVYAADAYVREVNYLLQQFHSSTGNPVAPARGGGSYTDAREIGEGAPADILISVALNAYQRNYLQERYSGWAVAFAADQMVIAYSNATLNSPVAVNVIKEFQTASETDSSDAFYGAFYNLTSGQVKIGISNPNSDPAGLRAYLTLEIAGSIYAGNQSYFIQRASANNVTVSESNAAELVSPLEFGSIQFLFIYRSTAISDHLPYISLPPELNQGDPGLSAFYSKYSYTLVGGAVNASPIYLFISVMANSSMNSEAYSFLYFLLNSSPALENFGLMPLKVPLLFYNVMPSQFSAMIRQGEMDAGGSL